MPASLPPEDEIARLRVEKPATYVAHVVAADWGPYEGWRKPLGVYSTEEKALAAVGRATVQGRYFAEKLHVVTLEVDAPLLDDDLRGD